MIVKHQVIENDHVAVFYSYTNDAVTIICKKTKETRIFNWPGVEGVFSLYYQSMLEETDFKATEEFFQMTF